MGVPLPGAPEPEITQLMVSDPLSREASSARVA